MEQIEKKLDTVLERLTRLEDRLNGIEGSCSGMDSHIGFIEGVYETLRSPLDYFTSQVNRWTGKESESLPELEGKKKQALLKC